MITPILIATAVFLLVLGCGVALWLALKYGQSAKEITVG